MDSKKELPVSTKLSLGGLLLVSALPLPVGVRAAASIAIATVSVANAVNSICRDQSKDS